MKHFLTLKATIVLGVFHKCLSPLLVLYNALKIVNQETWVIINVAKQVFTLHFNNAGCLIIW
jgi:hypothetical protein